MRRSLLFACSASIAMVLLFGGRGEIANAIPPFKKEFDAKYVKPDSTDETEMAFAAAVKEAKCNVCHVPKKKKTERNAYGDQLSELLDKKKDAKDPEKIQEALTKVGAMKIDPGAENSPTWDDFFDDGKLPGQLEENN